MKSKSKPDSFSLKKNLERPLQGGDVMNKKQEANRDSFVLYKSFYEPIAGLEDEELGRLFRAIFEWQICGNARQALEGAVGMAFGFIVNQFRVDNDKYLERCNQNRENAINRWKGRNNARASNGIQLMQTMPNDNDNEYNNDNDFNITTGSDPPAPPQKKSSKKFVKPSLNEVQEYCLERENNVDPVKFYDYYESVGWMIGRAHMKNWMAAVRSWERNINHNYLQYENNKRADPRFNFDGGPEKYDCSDCEGTI